MSTEDKILEKAIEVGAEMLPELISWAAGRIAGKSDPKAELRLMMASVDVAIEDYQIRELGPR